MNPQNIDNRRRTSILRDPQNIDNRRRTSINTDPQNMDNRRNTSINTDPHNMDTSISTDPQNMENRRRTSILRDPQNIDNRRRTSIDPQNMETKRRVSIYIEPQKMENIQETSIMIDTSKNLNDLANIDDPEYNINCCKCCKCCSKCCKCCDCCIKCCNRYCPCTCDFCGTIFFHYFGTTNMDRVRNIFRELIFYIIFVILATIVISSNLSNYWFTHIMKNEFIDDEFDTMYPSPITLLEVRNFEEVWKAIQNLLFESVYWDIWYDKANLTKHERVKLYLLGVPRIRQMRVKKIKCKAIEAKRSHKYCYYALNSKTLETADYGLKNDTFWKNEKNLSHYPYKGLIQTYGTSGYYLDLPLNERYAWKKITFMRKNKWIDRQTRVIFVDFTIYNANVNVFLIIKIAFEIPPTGGVVVSYKLHNVKLIAFVTPYDYIMLGIQGICLVYLFYYTICLPLSIAKEKWYFFTSSWNMLDVTLIILGYTYFTVCIYSVFLAQETLKQAIEKKTSFTSFDKVGYFFDQQDTILSIFMLLMYFKLFKYVDLSSRFGLINHTIKKSFKDLPAFTLVFFIVLMNFAFIGYYLFGSRVFDFSTIEMTMFTLIRALGGEFNYFELEKHYEYAGAIYFIAFILIVFFIFLNMFLGIISDAYITIKNGLQTFEDRDMARFLYNGSRNCKRSNCCRKADEDVKEPEPFHRLKELLEAAYYISPEIGLFSKNYEIKRDISPEEERQLLNELSMFQMKLIDSYEYIRMVNDLSTYVSQDNVEMYEAQLVDLEKKVIELNNLLRELYDRITLSQLVEGTGKKRKDTLASLKSESTVVGEPSTSNADNTDNTNKNVNQS